MCMQSVWTRASPGVCDASSLHSWCLYIHPGSTSAHATKSQRGPNPNPSATAFHKPCRADQTALESCMLHGGGVSCGLGARVAPLAVPRTGYPVFLSVGLEAQHKVSSGGRAALLIPRTEDLLLE
jgi:hypothetical protein